MNDNEVTYICVHMLLKSGKVIKYTVENKDNKISKKEYCKFINRGFKEGDIILFNLDNNKENTLMIKSSELVAIEVVEAKTYGWAINDVF